VKKRKPTKSNYAVAKGLRDYYEKQVLALTEKIARLQHELGKYKRAEERRKHEEQANWALYDRAVDATTQHERELFAASPAYQKYQQWRQQREIGAERDRSEAINFIGGRGLERGDWIAP
jgi:sugar-specific transcriptional regulator TrmB